MCICLKIRTFVSNKKQNNLNNKVMKEYYICQVQGYNVSRYAESIADMEKQAIKFSEGKVGGRTKIFVRAHVVTSTRKSYKCEKDVRYIIHINNQKMTITTRRI